MEDGNYAGNHPDPVCTAFESTRAVDTSEGAVRKHWTHYVFNKDVAIVPIPQKQNPKLAEMMVRQGLTDANMGTLGRSLTTRHFADYDRPIEDES